MFALAILLDAFAIFRSAYILSAVLVGSALLIAAAILVALVHRGIGCGGLAHLWAIAQAAAGV